MTESKATSRLRPSASGRYGLVLLALLACSSPEEYKEDADKEVYALIDARRDSMFAREAGFNIEADPESLRQRILAGEVTELSAVSLTQCLEIAAENSRDYQAAKESLYRSALTLTLARWRYTSIWSLDGGATLDGDGNGATDASGGADLGMSKLLGTGATVVSNIGLSMFRAVNTGDGWDAVSDASLSITQPLLRGAAREVVMEPLTQAERDLVYSVRDYESFRRDFVLDITAEYFSILLTMDRLLNEQANFNALSNLTEYNQQQYEAGRLSRLDLDEARQERLNSETALLQLQQDLGRQVDNFKITLGLPVETQLGLDTDALAQLGALAGEDVLNLEERGVIAIGLQRRLDLLNQLDALVDAERRVRIAENALRAGLDLSSSVSASSEEGQPLAFNRDNLSWTFGISFDLPIDNLDDRNVYRRSVIELQSAIRSTEQLNDRITADLSDRLRQTRSAKDRYEIQRVNVEINKRRVRNAALQLESGRSRDTFSVLRAQASLLDSQNRTSSALLEFALARLNLYRDLELLEFTPQGIVVDEEALPRLDPADDENENEE